MPVGGTRLEGRRTRVSSIPDWDTEIGLLNPYLWYKMDEASGSLINSGSAGTYSVPVGGGSAYSYAQPSSVNSNSAIELHEGYFETTSASPSYSASGGTTVFLIKPYQHNRLQWIGGWGTAASQHVKFFMQGSNGTFTATHIASASSATNRSTSTQLLNKGEWNLVVVTHDGTNRPEIYVNGVLETVYTDTSSSTPVSWWLNDFTPTRFGFGENTGDHSSWEHARFIGKLDEFVYFDGVQLNQSQVDNLYLASLIPSTAQVRESFEEGIGYYEPFCWCSFNETSAAMRNYGTDVTNSQSLMAGGSHTYAATQTSDADNAQKGLSCSGTAGTLSFPAKPFPAVASGGDVGAIFYVFNRTTDKSVVRYLMDFVRASSNTGRIVIQTEPTTGRISAYFQWYSQGNVYRGWQWGAGSEICDGNDHFLAFVQRGDGTGIHLFVDGSEVTSPTVVTSGATPPGLNTFFGDIAENASSFGLNSYGMLSLIRPTQSYFVGLVDHFSGVFNHAFTDQEIADLNALRV